MINKTVVFSLNFTYVGRYMMSICLCVCLYYLSEEPPRHLFFPSQSL